MNLIDILAGDDELITIRERQEKHKSLRRIEKATFEFKKDVLEATNVATKEYNIENANAEKELNRLFREYQDLLNSPDANSKDAAARLQSAYESAKRSQKVRQDVLLQEREEAIAEAENEREMKVRRIQSLFRWYSAIVPILVPSILGLIVFAWRRMREREGMSKSRIRK